MALTNLTQVKDRLDKDPSDTTLDSKIVDAIPMAERAVRQYCRRTFDLNVPADPPTTRTFTYEEGGVHVIDDFVHGSITAVAAADALSNSQALLPGAFIPRPGSDEYPVGWYVETLPVESWSFDSGMGFLQNADVYGASRPSWSPVTISVTAKWGWASPADYADVIQAVIWTVVSMIEGPRPYTTEAISGYSRTRSAPGDAIPRRAKDLLDQHAKG